MPINTPPPRQSTHLATPPDSSGGCEGYRPDMEWHTPPPYRRPLFLFSETTDGATMLQQHAYKCGVRAVPPDAGSARTPTLTPIAKLLGVAPYDAPKPPGLPLNL